MSMMKLAEHIVYLADSNNTPISNLQLQKIMYFTLVDAYQEGLISENKIAEIYDEPFLVWRYGPVIESVYDRYSINGASPIWEEGIEHECFKPLDIIIIGYCKKGVTWLVNKSHQSKYWKDNAYKIGIGRSDIEYPLEELKNA